MAKPRKKTQTSAPSFSSVEKKVYFFQVQPADKAGQEPEPVDVRPALTHINGLSFDNGDRYWKDARGVETCCYVDHLDGPPRIRLFNVRRSGLPLIEDAGSFSDLPIPLTSGLAEPIHIVVFHEANCTIVAADANFFGPRVTRLSGYFLEKALAKCVPISVLPLYRRDVIARLAKFSDLTLFRLSIEAPYAAAVEHADHDLGSALKSQAAVSKADVVEVVLKMTKGAAPTERQSFTGYVTSVAKKLLGLENLHGGTNRFCVAGHTFTSNKVEDLDLLSDAFIVKTQVLKENSRSRALEPKSAFVAIETAYRDLRPDLLESVTGKRP